MIRPAFVIDRPRPPTYFRAFPGGAGLRGALERTMKIINSLKSAKKRHKDCRVIRRKGRVYVINKSNPRFKARQG